MNSALEKSLAAVRSALAAIAPLEGDELHGSRAEYWTANLEPIEHDIWLAINSISSPEPRSDLWQESPWRADELDDRIAAEKLRRAGKVSSNLFGDVE